MERKEELLKLFENHDSNLMTLITPIIDEVVFLEEQLKYTKKLDHIRISKENSALQKSTPAYKMYKEYLQQYHNQIKLLISLIEVKDSEGQDHLLEGLEMLKKRYENY